MVTKKWKEVSENNFHNGKITLYIEIYFLLRDVHHVLSALNTLNQYKTSKEQGH